MKERIQKVNTFQAIFAPMKSLLHHCWVCHEGVRSNDERLASPSRYLAFNWQEIIAAF